MTWNPRRWEWDDLADEARKSRSGDRFIKSRWSCGRTRRIRNGDRLFLLRQGVEPRGIVASGYASSDAYEDDHWDPNANSRTSMFVDWNCDVVLDPSDDAILSWDELTKPRLRHGPWSTQSSGVLIPEKIAPYLEALWLRLLRTVRPNAGTLPVQNAGTTYAASRGAGFGIPENNALVENSAIQHATKWYRHEGWNVVSCERDCCGFDLRCVRNRAEQNAEVKGVAGADQAFVITEGEVNQARMNPHFVLWVVTNALSRRPTANRYSGAEFLRHFQLTPIQYRASLTSPRR
jgi:hypothetical protein